MKKFVTPEQFAEGWIQFVNGVVIKRSFTNFRRLADGNYEVEVPESKAPANDRIPVVDAR